MRVMGSFVLSDAVWNEAGWFFISTAPITPACSNSASAPRLADQASVRGERLAKKPANRAAETERSRRPARRLRVDRRKQLLHGARRRRAEAFVEIDGLGIFLPDHGVLPGEFGIAGQRFLDAAGIARIQRAGRMPGQQHFDFTGLLLQHFLARCHHGQPRSTPAAFSSSASFLRA